MTTPTGDPTERGPAELIERLLEIRAEQQAHREWLQCLVREQDRILGALEFAVPEGTSRDFLVWTSPNRMHVHVEHERGMGVNTEAVELEDLRCFRWPEGGPAAEGETIVDDMAEIDGSL